MRELRLSKGWSQSELSKRAKVPQPTIAHIELGRIPNLKNMMKLSKALEVKPEELIDQGEITETLCNQKKVNKRKIYKKKGLNKKRKLYKKGDKVEESKTC